MRGSVLAKTGAAAIVLAGASYGIGWILFPPVHKTTVTIRSKADQERLDMARREAKQEDLVQRNGYLSGRPALVQAAHEYVRSLPVHDLRRARWAVLFDQKGDGRQAYVCIRTLLQTGQVGFSDSTYVDLYKRLAARFGDEGEVKEIEENFGKDSRFKRWKESEIAFLQGVRNSTLHSASYQEKVTRACRLGRESFPEHLDEIIQMENELLALKRQSP